MTTYLSGSNIKGETMQTLYLMNPSFSGYNDSANSNMVLVSTNGGVTSQTSALGSPHYAFSNTSPMSHQSNITTLSNLNGSHQNTSPEMLKAGIGGAQGYNWNGGNELLFLPASEMRDDNQSFGTHLSTISAGQEQSFGSRKLLQASFPEQVPFISTGIATGYNSTESLQASTGSGQILSLSLSPQQSQLSQWQQAYPIQQSGLGVNNPSILTKQDWIRASPNMVEMGLHNPLIAATNAGLVNALSNGPPKMELHSSKYLRAAQQLLNEVVGPGNVVKPKTPANLTKMQSWSSACGSLNSGVPNQEKALGDKTPKDESALVSWIEDKDALNVIPSMSNNTTSVSEQTGTEPVIELTIAQRQELQAKKDKLMAMLDEVDQRYKLYYHQMQMVVASFESAAGMGAARPYTAVALQTISRHFRCLKDAVRGQVRDVCKKLGEEPCGQLKGETSRLRFIDQQLRQQRALQQLGMMQQHPWRPQRGLPERSVSILRAWLFEHFLHPYPKDSDKVLLARQTGLTRNQVSNWFINARVRLWKPMVEEMYVEEMKESDINDDGSNKATTSEGETTKKAHFTIDGTGNNEANNRVPESGLLENEQQSTDMFQNRGTTGSLQDSFLFHGKEAHDTVNRQLENYNIPMQDDNQNVGGSNNGSIFQFNQVSKYPNEGLSSYGNNSSGVSLTLGLRHSEGLSLSGSTTHQTFMQGQGLQMVRQHQDGATNQTNYYPMHEIPGGHNGSY